MNRPEIVTPLVLPKFNIAEWSLIFTALMIYLSTAFQIGYFWAVGLQFITLTTSTEWLFFTAIAAVPAILIMSAAITLSAIAISAGVSPHTVVIGTNVLTFCALIALFLMPLTLLATLVFLTALCTQLTAMVVEIWVGPVRGSRVHRWEFVAAIAAFGLLSIFVGFMYPMTTARDCTFIEWDGKFEKGKYLRSLGDGYLIKNDKEVVYLPKSSVLRLSCDRKWPDTQSQTTEIGP